MCSGCMLALCEVLPFSVCPADRFLESLKKKKTQRNVLSLFTAVFMPPFCPLSCYQKQFAPVSLQLLQCFPRSVEDMHCNSQPHEWQQAGKTHLGFRKLWASQPSLGRCSESNPSNTSGTAVVSRVSIPLTCTLLFLPGFFSCTDQST